VLLISVVSFPLLLDRDVGLSTAVWTSVRAVTVNPVPMALWGLVVAAGLLVGSIPLFLGLIIVLQSSGTPPGTSTARWCRADRPRRAVSVPASISINLFLTRAQAGDREADYDYGLVDIKPSP
jgi:hypothetical protein